MEFILLGILSLIVGFGLGYILNQRRARAEVALRAVELAQKSQELAQKEQRLIAVETAHTLLERSFATQVTALEQERRLNAKLKETTAALESTNLHLAQAKSEALGEHTRQRQDMQGKLEQLNGEKRQIEKELIALREQEPIRADEHNRRIERLNEAQLFVERERVREAQLRAGAEAERQLHLRETWVRHETDVEQRMRLVCQELGINYIDKEKFPHGGKPDNTVHICEEYIVFDSKSPQGEDLGNFPAYIRREAEAAKKYLKSEDVRKDIFFVVPTSAIGVLKSTFLPLGAHRVHIVTMEALHSILFQLKKIEDYEFAEKLSPEDREKIVGILGRMAHGMKRRIQVDHFFANEFISVLTDAENLPAEILKAAQVVERSSKLNPPIEKRAKQIEIGALAKEREKLNGKVESQDIHLGPELQAIDTIPLHR